MTVLRGGTHGVDLFPGVVDVPEALFGEMHGLLGHAACLEAVGMTVAHEGFPGGADFGHRHVRRHPQDGPRIRPLTGDEPGAQGAETALFYPEYLCDAGEKRILL